MPNLYNLIPALNKYKTLIGSYGLMALGLGAFFVGLGGLFNAIGHCLTGLEYEACTTGLANAWEPLVVAFVGLTGLGLGHKIEKANS